MNVLCIAAHPDDEVLGCGGTLARLAREGHDVHIAILGEGITSRYEKREQADPALVEALRKRSQQAAKILGAKNMRTCDLPDNRFDTVPLLDIIKIVEDLLHSLRPEAVYLNHGGDLNIDHVISHRAVLSATRPLKGQTVKEVYAYEVPSSTDWSFQSFGQSLRSNVFVDISETLETKVKALSEYETEVRTFPHPRSPEAIRAIARRWGSVIGCEAAEAFELVRSLR